MLDLGCGKGIVSLYAAARGLTVDAVDKTPEPPPLFRDVPNIRFVAADLEQWTPTRTYDIILCHYVLHFLDRTYVVRDFLPTLIHHLNPRGVLQLFVFTPQDFTSVPTKFSPEELLPIFRNLDISKNEMFIEKEDHPPIGKHEHHTLWLAARR
ncbi:MAG: hypothetical protein G01um101438_669 [Parcubacteria group bacterium Gr01-1014_38]|nr:MAG: hypothetical protein G01um101438_669 [Parcubacteria group bacterium Gr01-1014_38]